MMSGFVSFRKGGANVKQIPTFVKQIRPGALSHCTGGTYCTRGHHETNRPFVKQIRPAPADKGCCVCASAQCNPLSIARTTTYGDCRSLHGRRTQPNVSASTARGTQGAQEP